MIAKEDFLILSALFHEFFTVILHFSMDFHTKNYTFLWTFTQKITLFQKRRRKTGARKEFVSRVSFRGNGVQMDIFDTGKITACASGV